MIKVLCSTGALITRFNGRDPSLLQGIVPKLRADGLEFMIYPSWDDKLGFVRNTMRALVRGGAFIPVVHADKHIGELLSVGEPEGIVEAGERMRRNLEIAAELGAELMVLHLWGGPASDRHIEVNIAQLPAYIELAKSFGIELTVENVICGGKTPLAHIKRIISELPEAGFTIDTKMAEFHLELPATLECKELWQGRVRHLHVNDYAGGYRDFNDLRVRHIGEGHVDFRPFFMKVRESGYEGFATVESTSVLPDGAIDFGKLNRSLGLVRDGLNGEKI